MTYHHLISADRIKIGALLQVEVSIIEIAQQLKRPKSTIYREIQRNSFNGSYIADSAQGFATTRKSQASQDRCVDEETEEIISEGLGHGMSPEQISGRLKLEDASSTSTSMIYSHIKKDKKAGGDLWISLRRSGKSYRKKYGLGGTSENGIKNRISIEKRPPNIENRTRHGDLEGDTMIGAKHKGVLLSMNDRVTQKVSIDKLESKTSAEVCQAMIMATNKFEGKIYSCTLDNGKEFADHENYTQSTGVRVYFCHTMSPQERGSNENTNGLIRQYIPKGTDISKVSKERIKFIEYSLNSRPRKTLNFRTPLEIESRGKIKFKFFG